MNNLVVDIGNSNVVVGYCVNKECIVKRFETDINFSIKHYTKLFKEAFGEIEVSNVLISSVVPIVTQFVVESIEKLYSKNISFVNASYNTDVNIVTDNPNEVGADLICGVAGAMKYSSDGIVIDLGTASKVSYYKNNTFLGVIISPGIKVSANSLTSSASLLSQFILEKPKKVFGTNTIECMQSGVVLGHIAMINGLLEMAFQELGEQLPIYLTGGLGYLVKDDLKYDVVYDKHLLINALDEMIYKQEN